MLIRQSGHLKENGSTEVAHPLGHVAHRSYHPFKVVSGQPLIVPLPQFYEKQLNSKAAILNMVPNSTFLEVTRLFWAKIKEDLANFSGIYGGLASRKVNLELLTQKLGVLGRLRFMI
jgi:hypothetical protein